MSTSIRPGDTLADRYRLDDLLSESGSGRFWRAHDRVLKRKVALHVIAADDDRAPGLLEAARRSATVINPRILRVLDAQLRSDTCFVVNEWGYGTSLDIALANNGPLVPRRAAWVVAEVADSIATAHAHGVHHGRLVPENVLIDSTGNIRIIGLSVDAAMHGLPPGDETGDVRDLAGLLHAALTGKWAGESSSAVPAAPSEGGRVLRPRQVRAGVPRPLDDMVDELLNPATARRGARDLGSASAVAAYLTDFVGDPAGISDTLAAANPCRAPEQVVLEQVPDFVPRPATPFKGPSPAPLPVSTPDTAEAAEAAEVVEDDDPMTTTAARPAVRDSGPDTSAALPRIHERRLQAAARAHAAGSTPTVTSADPAAVPLRPAPLPAAAALASVRAVGRPVAVAEPLAVAEPQTVAQPASVAELVVVPVEEAVEEAVEAPVEAPAETPADTQAETEADEARQGERSRLAELAHRYAEPEVVREQAPAPRSRDAARRAAHAARASAADPISSRIDYFTSLYSASGPTEPGPVGGGESWEDEDWTDDGTWLVDPDDLEDDDQDDQDDELDDAQDDRQDDRRDDAPAARAAGTPASYDAAGFARGDTAARIPAVAAPVRGPLFAPADDDGPDRVAARRSRLRPGADDDRPWDREDTPPSQHPWLEAQERDADDDSDDSADQTATTGPRAFLADRRRLLLVLLSVLAVVLLVATLVTWRAGADSADAPTPAAPPAPPAATGALVPGLTAEVFDPTGNPGGAVEGADLAVDGDPATSWTTGTFTEQFSPGGARPGLGLLVDTGSVQALSQVDLTLDGSPTYVVLYAVSELPQSLATLKPTADFQAGTSEQVGLPTGTTGRYVVVWLTQIPQVGANHEGGIAEVAVHS